VTVNSQAFPLLRSMHISFQGILYYYISETSCCAFKIYIVLTNNEVTVL